jgi:DNA replication protein DnaC
MITILVNFFKFVYVSWSDLIRKMKSGRSKEFDGYGVYMFVGLPGSGKTISVVEYLNRLKEKYGDGVNIYTNFRYSKETAPVKSWRDLINYEGPAVFVLDEVQLTFNSRSWKDFPPDMVTLLTQNRKMRKQIITTSQSFERVDKVFRELVNYVIECRCVGGRWIFQKWFEKEDYVLGGANDNIRHRRRAKRYNFIASDDIYNSYDTLLRLDDLKKEEYITRGEKLISELECNACD